MIQKKLSEKAHAFIKFLAEISNRDKKILIKRFYNNKSMEKVAKTYKLSKPRIQQIENELIKKIDKLI